jgi:hypothetical protein
MKDLPKVTVDSASRKAQHHHVRKNSDFFSACYLLDLCHPILRRAARLAPKT